MGLRIATNIPAQTVLKNLNNAGRVESKELDRLSSGKRITKSADDAVGLAISKNLEAQGKGLRQAVRNANDGISLVQTAEGGLNEVSNILTRLRELTIQASSDTVGEAERGYLNLEYQQLNAEVDRIAESTTFNGSTLLNGEGRGDMDIQVGTYAAESNRISFDTSVTNASGSALGISSSGIDTKENAKDSMESLDMAINNISGQRAVLGSVQSRLQTSVANLETQAVNQDAARSMIEDADIASSTAALASSAVIKNAAIASLSQANTLPNSALRLIG